MNGSVNTFGRAWSGFPDGALVPWAVAGAGAALTALTAGAASVFGFETALVVATAAAAGATGLLLHLRWPVLGFAAMMIASLIVPVQIGTATKTALNMPFLLAPALTAAWVLGIPGRRRHAAATPKSVAIPLVLLIGACLVSFGIAKFGWYSGPAAPLRAQVGQIAIFAFSAGVFFAAARQLGELRAIRAVTTVFLVCGAFRILLSLSPYLSESLQGIVSTTAMGSVFWTWLPALAVANAIANDGLKPGWRLVSGAVAVLCLATALIGGHDWISGWLPGCIAVAVVFALRAPRLTAVLLILALIAGVAGFNALSSSVWTSDEQYSATTRAQAAKVVWKMIGTSPVVGFGPANYYHYTRFHSILGWYVPFSSHNNYLDILLQTGFLGLACFAGFLAALLRVAVRLARRAPSGFARAYAYAALGGLAGTLCGAGLGDWFLPFVYNVGIDGFRTSILAWVFLGGIVALDRTCREQTAGAQPQPLRRT